MPRFNSHCLNSGSEAVDASPLFGVPYHAYPRSYIFVMPNHVCSFDTMVLIDSLALALSSGLFVSLF